MFAVRQGGGFVDGCSDELESTEAVCKDGDVFMGKSYIFECSIYSCELSSIDGICRSLSAGVYKVRGIVHCPVYGSTNLLWGPFQAAAVGVEVGALVLEFVYVRVIQLE